MSSWDMTGWALQITVPPLVVYRQVKWDYPKTPQEQELRDRHQQLCRFRSVLSTPGSMIVEHQPVPYHPLRNAHTTRSFQVWLTYTYKSTYSIVLLEGSWAKGGVCSVGSA